MTADLFEPRGVDAAVNQLEADLTAPAGPSISTMRNHNFAILLYAPREEYRVRQRLHRMTHRLKGDGWGVLSIALHQVVLDRLRRELGPDEVEALIALEKRQYVKSPERALKLLKDEFSPLIDGESGLAADVAKLIEAHRAEYPEPDRTLVLLGRAGALYPFFRSSALLKHLGSRTGNVPVVLLYPGERREGGLSFMQVLAPDRDYRPRIYA